MIGRSTEKRSHNREWAIVAALSLLVLLLRLPSLEQPFDNDSGAIAYHGRLITRGEPLYGTHHPAHHLPATYYAYALAFLLFGDSVWAVKLMVILWTIVAVYLLYRLGVLVGGRTTGVLAAVFYSILTSHIYLAGTTAEIELFANLPRVAAILVLLCLNAQSAAAWKYVFVGLLGAAAFLFKAVYLSPLAMAGFVLLVESWKTRTKAGVWRFAVMRGLWVGAGFAAGVLPVIAYFGLLDLLPRFLLVFTVGREYVGFRTTAIGPQYVFLYPLAGLAVNNAVLLMLSLAGLLVVARNKVWGSRSRRGGRSSVAFYVVLWYILSFVEAGITRVHFPHYYLLIVPSLALLAAWFLLKMYWDARNQGQMVGRFAGAILLASLAGVLFISIRLNSGYYYRYAQYKLGLDTYQDFVRDGLPGHGEGLLRVQKIADYAREHTSPGDYIYYWSGDTQIYYLADRRCPIDIIWPLYADATGSYKRIFSPRTKYVILGESNNIPRPEWLYAELDGKYALEVTIEDQEVYRRMY